MSEQHTHLEDKIHSYTDAEICRIVYDTANSLEEVSKFVETSLSENLNIKVLGKESINTGIKITREEDKLQILIHINVFFGVNIPQLSYDLQSKIKKAVENETNLYVNAVNISVEGVDRK